MTEGLDVRRGTDPLLIETGPGFADALTELRHRAGRSIRDVARTTGIPSATLGGYFSGRHLPPATQPQLLGQVLDALGVHDATVQAEWDEALLRVRHATSTRGPGAAGAAAPAGARAAGPSPYPGLEPFTESDAGMFFGREGTVEDLVAEVTARAADPDRGNLLVLVGPSGTGKSSVLRAGLVPSLRSTGDAGGGPWTVAALVPGADPTGALDAALSAIAGSPRALLVVDQAEEVFSPEVSADARAAFIQALANESAADRADGRTVVVVVGLRADFYGQAAADPVILPALQNAQVLLGSMPISDLRRAIVQPAESAGVAVDPELVDLLLRDLSPRGQAQAGYDAGALPLVSHALLATWQRHRGNRLTVADYLAAGGIAGAVQQTAEIVVGQLDDSGRAAAQWLFAQLVVVDDDGAMTRRRVSHDDLRHPDPATDLALDAVIEAFVAGRLLTAGDDTLEVSHEALLTAWPRLHDWVLTDLDAARLQRRISDAAAAWRERDRDPAALLRGGPLADAQSLAEQPLTSHRVLSAAEEEFVAASAAQAEQERSAERHRTNRLRSLVAVMTVLAVLAGLLAGVAVRARNDAQAQQQLATTARDQALSRQLAIAADNLSTSDPALGAQLALAAYRVSPTLQARSSLLASTGAPTPTRFVGPAGEMHATSSADGSVLAVSGSDGTTRLWLRGEAGYAPAGELPAIGDATSIYTSAFSPNGQLLAIGTANGDVDLWDLSDVAAPTQVAVLDSAESSVQSMAFSADGAQLAVGTSEPAVRRWVLPTSGAETPAELAPITTGFAGMVKSVAYSPDSTVLATGSADGAIRLWSVPADGAAQLLSTSRVGEATNFVHAVAFSPDGALLGSAEKDRVVRLWDVSNPRSPEQRGEPLGGFDSWVNSVEFSPDGQSVAAGSSDGTARVFAVGDGQPLLTVPAPAAVNDAQFVGNGTALLTSEVDGVARLWTLPGPVLGGFANTVWSIQRNSDESMLAVGPGSADGSVHLFDTTDPSTPVPIGTLTPPEGAGTADGAAALSSDGRWVAAGTATGNVAVWERTAGTDEFTQSGVVTVSDELVEAVAISPDGRLVTGIADDGSVGVWTLVPGAAPQEAHSLSIPGLPLGVAFSPDSSLLAVGSTDGSVHLWRLAGAGAGGAAEELATLTGFDNYVYGVTFDPTGQFLAAGSTDRTLRIWDMTDPAAAVPVGGATRGPADTVYALSWGADGTLAGASKEGKLWLWDMADPAAPEPQATLPIAEGSLYAVNLSSGGARVSAGGSAATVVTWQTDPEAVAAATCAATGTPMTEAEWEQVAPGVPYAPPCSMPAQS